MSLLHANVLTIILVFLEMMQQNQGTNMSELFLTFGLIYLYHQNTHLALTNLIKAKLSCSDTTKTEIQDMINNALNMVQQEPNNECTTKFKNQEENA